MKCTHCKRPATHRYRNDPVCVEDYKNRARIDDGPGRIPKDYDWATELNNHRLN